MPEAKRDHVDVSEIALDIDEALHGMGCGRGPRTKIIENCIIAKLNDAGVDLITDKFGTYFASLHLKDTHS